MPKMGLGLIGNPQVIFKKKNRWAFTINCQAGPDYSVAEDFTKIAARPKATIENVEIPYKNSTLNIPGKAKFEEITVVYYDVAFQNAVHIYNWVNLFNNQFSSNAAGRANENKWDQNEMRGWYSDGVLTMFDGCGSKIESWTLHYLYPTSYDFGDLDYASSEVAEISISMRYSEITFRNEGCFSDVVFACRSCNS
jgi:hypothetical protein